MKPEKEIKAWSDVFQFPVPGRSGKPRNEGVTMIIDKGLGISETADLLELASDYIDFIKLGFGTSAFYSWELLREKINLVKSYEVDIYPGGTFFEVAFLQGNFDAYLQRAGELGFATLEISDGTINIEDEVRVKIIEKAKNCGFRVITEVGKKNPEDNLTSTQIACYVNMDLASGADKVIVEGRESGKGIGVYDKNGAIKENAIDDIVKGIKDQNNIIWEAPLKGQQEELIIRFGSNVNLGNIQPYDILSLEALRVGLRADTLQIAINKNPEESASFKNNLGFLPLNPGLAKT